MSDHCPECGVDPFEHDMLSRNADKAIPQFWHLGTESEGYAGPFATLEEAKADALTYLQDNRWRVPEVTIVQTVAVSRTEVTFKTNWRDELTKVD